MKTLILTLLFAITMEAHMPAPLQWWQYQNQANAAATQQVAAPPKPKKVVSGSGTVRRLRGSGANGATLQAPEDPALSQPMSGPGTIKVLKGSGESGVQYIEPEAKSYTSTPVQTPTWWDRTTQKIKDKLNDPLLSGPNNMGTTYMMNTPLIDFNNTGVQQYDQPIGPTLPVNPVSTGTPYSIPPSNMSLPGFNVVPSLANQPTAPGFGTNYYGTNWKQRRGGGGGGGGYTPSEYLPPFYLGLNSWNFGE